MIAPVDREKRFATWIAALEERHLANLTPSEVARALRALSSCYVERREKLASGDALGSAGKRAAFALFYAPLHFLVISQVVRALGAAEVNAVTDLGCGNGAAGGAWALESGGATVAGFDRHPWAVAEASWTYRVLGLSAKARQMDLAAAPLRGGSRSGVLAAYTVNELPPAARGALLPRLLDAASAGARVLVVEPIARKGVPWWTDWAATFAGAGGRADEWRFPAALPARQLQLARAAGLDPRELTARSLWL